MCKYSSHYSLNTWEILVINVKWKSLWFHLWVNVHETKEKNRYFRIFFNILKFKEINKMFFDFLNYLKMLWWMKTSKYKHWDEQHQTTVAYRFCKARQDTTSIHKTKLHLPTKQKICCKATCYFDLSRGPLTCSSVDMSACRKWSALWNCTRV